MKRGKWVYLLQFVLVNQKKITMAPPLKKTKQRKHPNTLPHDFVVAMVSSVRNRCGQKNRAYVFCTNQWEWYGKRNTEKTMVSICCIHLFTHRQIPACKDMYKHVNIFSFFFFNENDNNLSVHFLINWHCMTRAESTVWLQRKELRIYGGCTSCRII